MFALSAENLINILQTRDGAAVHSQNSPVQAPECCSYNSHGSSIQESPSERESQDDTEVQHLILSSIPEI